jgi:hypothetical protein
MKKLIDKYPQMAVSLGFILSFIMLYVLGVLAGVVKQ